MRLDPNYPFYVLFNLANSYYGLRRYDQAIENYKEVVRRNPDFPGAHEQFTIVYAELGRDNEARAEAAELLRINLGYSVSWLRDHLPLEKQADLDRTISGLCKAGLK